MANKASVEKAYKAQRWIEEARLNIIVPELLDTAQLWPYWIKLPDDKRWSPPVGLSEIEGKQDRKKPWAAWRFDGRHWKIEAEWGPTSTPDSDRPDSGKYRISVDSVLVCDMTLSADDLRTMWVDALTVGPWVSELIRFAGERKLESQALSSASFHRHHKERAENITL